VLLEALARQAGMVSFWLKGLFGTEKFRRALRFTARKFAGIFLMCLKPLQPKK
jgi:hypothetical protein